jgi:hypothetical protein
MRAGLSIRAKGKRAADFKQMLGKASAVVLGEGTQTAARSLLENQRDGL